MVTICKTIDNISIIHRYTDNIIVFNSIVATGEFRLERGGKNQFRESELRFFFFFLNKRSYERIYGE